MSGKRSWDEKIKKAAETQMTPTEILKRPYARVLIPESDGRVTAEIMEFPGCVTFGDDNREALARLEEVAADWIQVAISRGQQVPEPMDAADFSGRLVLRMPRGLHKRAAMCADREGVSLNHFIVASLAEAVGERSKPPTVNMLATVSATLMHLPSKTVVGLSQSTFSYASVEKHDTTSPSAGRSVILETNDKREAVNA